ncbi:hypothetical protein ETB97_003555 [Aspergillus alliaceus]|uniref:Uncharacterized protein n=1 Tax=Petromyces alliaceus TaxID=209559 RepID=A0A8H5ZZY8_PETAA|nr:hypothetical protein ETB97_003555 [Aspergillus burnettii]
MQQYSEALSSSARGIVSSIALRDFYSTSVIIVAAALTVLYPVFLGPSKSDLLASSKLVKEVV